MPRYRLHPTRAFWLTVILSVAVLMVSAAPSPLYPLYQQRWGFSAVTLTVIFAVYVAALLVSLLTVGSISDHIGRRPVLAASLLLLIVALGIFIAADGVSDLIVARIVQGLATGGILGTLSATLIDLQPNPRLGGVANGAAPGFGLGLGAAFAGFLVEYAPAPRFLVYEISAGLLAVLFIALLIVPETSTLLGFTSRRHLAKTLAPRASLPPSVRATFLAGVPAILATWSLGGLQLSLGSSIAGRLLGVHNHASVGLILFTFFAAAGVAAIVFAAASTARKLAVGYCALLAGVAISLAGIVQTSVTTYVVGTAVAGIGFGLAFSGVMATIAAVTAPSDRGQVFASVYVLAYIGFSAPAVVAGFTTESYGLRDTAIGYSIYVLALVILAAAAAAVLARRNPRSASRSRPEDPDNAAPAVVASSPTT